MTMLARGCRVHDVWSNLSHNTSDISLTNAYASKTDLELEEGKVSWPFVVKNQPHHQGYLFLPLLLRQKLMLSWRWEGKVTSSETERAGHRQASGLQVTARFTANEKFRLLNETLPSKGCLQKGNLVQMGNLAPSSP